MCVCVSRLTDREQLIGKLSALLGSDCRVGQCGILFTHIDALRSVCDSLHAAGYPRMGREVMYSGVNGKRLDGPVFLGMVYYQRLRHMVQDRTPW